MISYRKEIKDDIIDAENHNITDNKADSIVKIPLFTLARLERISNGNPAFLLAMVKVFIEYMPGYVQNIRTAILAQDCDLLKDCVHKIKPTVYDMEIHSLKEVIKELKLLSTTHKCTPKTYELVNYLDQTVSDIINQLQREFYS